MVLGQTLGVRLILRMNYFKKFQVALLPLIAVIIAFPFALQWLEQDIAWIAANLMLFVVGIQHPLKTFCRLLHRPSMLLHSSDQRHAWTPVHWRTDAGIRFRLRISGHCPINMPSRDSSEHSRRLLLVNAPILQSQCGIADSHGCVSPSKLIVNNVCKFFLRHEFIAGHIT